MVAASSLLVGAIAFTLQASADPIGPPLPGPDTTFRLSDPITGVAWLFCVNVLLNMLFYSGLLLAVAKKYLSSSGIIETSGIRFFVALVCAVTVISLIGAAVDFYLLAQPRFIDTVNNHAVDNPGTYRVIVLDLANWMAALSVISLSVIACPWFLLRLRVSMGLLIAAGFVIINLVFWILIGVFGEDVTFLTILFGVLSAPIVVRGLLRWYVTERPLLAQSSPVP